jgi:uncharacterized protein (DUF849 family)
LENDMTRKVIITRAVTGSIRTPSMAPYLPVMPAQIANLTAAYLSGEGLSLDGILGSAN